jgi:hypothetical protein
MSLCMLWPTPSAVAREAAARAPLPCSLNHSVALMASDCAQDGATPLVAAARNGHVPVVEALLRCPGVDVEAASKVREATRCAARMEGVAAQH